MKKPSNLPVAEPVLIGQRISSIQSRQMKITARLCVINAEADALEEEATALRTEHLELLRRFDQAARLP